jgi:adenylylsulfate kinase-like enzyme
MRGELKNFVGFDIKFPEPVNPDLVINNEGDNDIEEVVEEIWNNIPEGFLQPNKQ